MFAKFKNFRRLFIRAVKFSPAELIASVLFFMVAVISYCRNGEADHWLWSFPMCFCLIYVFNRLTTPATRWLYYLSVLSIPGFWLWNLLPGSPLFCITLIVGQLLVTLSIRETDNDSFIGNILCYVRDMTAAILLAFLGWLLAWAIHTSLVYIFDLHVVEWRFIIYSGQMASLLVAPILFLIFTIRNNQRFTVNPFFDVLVNFMVSPALLIYNLILYIYFIKIVAVWALPKGGVAYMILFFTLFLLVSKSVQAVLRRRYYDWYYNYFSFWIFPPLIMLWISTLYRIREYGWTEWRVYLVLTAVIVTATMFLFFCSRWGKYRWIAVFSVTLLVLFTYIPGIDAKSWALRSQYDRVEQMKERLYSRNNNQWIKDTDSLTLKQYKILYNSAGYIQKMKDTFYMREHFGFTQNDLEHLIPAVMMEQVKRYRSTDHFYSLWYGDLPVVIQEFDTLYRISSMNGKQEVSFRYMKGHLWIGTPSDTLVYINVNTVFRERLAKNGMDTTSNITGERLEELKEVFRLYSQNNKQVIVERIQINTDRLTVEDVHPEFLLIRKE